MNGEAIRKKLAKESVNESRPTLEEQLIESEIKDMCEQARRRVVFNFSGALPGPPRDTPTISRRILDFLARDPRLP